MEEIWMTSEVKDNFLRRAERYGYFNVKFSEEVKSKGSIVEYKIVSGIPDSVTHGIMLATASKAQRVLVTHYS